MTKEKAIELVKKEIQECDPDNLANVSEVNALPSIEGYWNVTCKYKESVKTPVGQMLDSVTYIVTNDGTVLAIPV